MRSGAAKCPHLQCLYQSVCDHCDVAIVEGIIVNVGPQLAVRGKEEIDLDNAVLVPGFIDAHVHIESSMLRPTEFARLILSKGTTTIVADPHEIANVWSQWHSVHAERRSKRRRRHPLYVAIVRAGHAV